MKSSELEQKALAVLRAIAESVANESGREVRISGDCGFGTATITLGNGAHTHVGSDVLEDAERNFESFVNGLYGLICLGRGLSFQPSKFTYLESASSNELPVPAETPEFSSDELQQIETAGRDMAAGFRATFSPEDENE